MRFGSTQSRLQHNLFPVEQTIPALFIYYILFPEIQQKDFLFARYICG
jgi:hypothetical protein